MKTNTTITAIKNENKLKTLPNQYRRNINVNYFRLKEILFEDERILYFLIVFISLFTIWYIFSIHQKNKSTFSASSLSVNEISTNKDNLVLREALSDNQIIDGNNLNYKNKFPLVNAAAFENKNISSYALSDHQINQLKRLLLTQPSHQPVGSNYISGLKPS